MAIDIYAEGAHVRVAFIDERSHAQVLILFICDDDTAFPGAGIGIIPDDPAAAAEDGKRVVYPMFLRAEGVIEVDQDLEASPTINLTTSSLPAGVLRFHAARFIDRLLAEASAGRRALDLTEDVAVEWGYLPSG